MWEYTELSGWVNNLPDLLGRMNALGACGWQAIGITSTDKTIGLNGFTVILRREVLGWPAHDGEPEWAPDPTGRFDHRWWDGLRWTEHVLKADGAKAFDVPNRRPA